MTDLPDTPAGRAAAWLVAALERDPDDLVDHVAPSMRSLITPASLVDLREQFGDVSVERVGHQLPHYLVTVLATATGRRALTLYVEPEHPNRITGARIESVEGDPWRPGEGDTVLRRIHAELELAAIAGTVVSRAATWFGAAGDVDEHSRFSIGSITKTMTAALVTQLVDDGLVSLDDPLDRLVGDVEVPPGVTTGLVLEHRSGLVSDAPLEGRPDIPGLFAQHPLRCAFEPGTQRQYSNAGYGLLGHLVETVSGASYADALAAGVFEPAGMVESGVDPADVLPGFLSMAGVLQPVPWLDVAIPGAGAVISTASDMARYLVAVRDGVLPRAGWVVDGDIVWHNGGWDGFSAMAWLDLARSRGTVLLTNTGRVSGVGLLERRAPQVVDAVCDAGVAEGRLEGLTHVD